MSEELSKPTKVSCKALAENSTLSKAEKKGNLLGRFGVLRGDASDDVVGVVTEGRPGERGHSRCSSGQGSSTRVRT